MKIVEIRILDGPNVFLDGPAVKIEFALDPGESMSHLAGSCESATEGIRNELSTSFPQLQADVHWREVETPGHVVVVFRWQRREYTRCIAESVAESIINNAISSNPSILAECRNLLDLADIDSDTPNLIHADDYDKTLIAVTGTNGKTTTTRLIAHIFMQSGKSVGWSSSSGVYVNGEEILEGDYSGPQGVRAVVAQADVEVGIFESARGGILLRGLAFDQADVTVFTNISADHLDLQGVHSVEGLAQVKAVVCEATRVDGVAVLNADDPLVMSACAHIPAQKWLISRNADSPLVRAHVDVGGTALLADSQNLELMQSGASQVIVNVQEIPMTYHGRAGFMIENALLAAAASLAAGATAEEVKAGLLSFESSPGLNPGRMNVYALDDVVIVIDFAHNEAGLSGLLDFAESLEMTGRIISVVGSAGDRNDEAILTLGKISALRSDYTITKGTYKYLRGRELSDLMRLYREGIAAGGATAFEETEDEIVALSRSLEIAAPGDVILVMAQEFLPELHGLLTERGAILFTA